MRLLVSPRPTLFGRVCLCPTSLQVSQLEFPWSEDGGVVAQRWAVSRALPSSRCKPLPPRAPR
jgi:hypothetical protein